MVKLLENYIETLIAEATEIDFKADLEVKKPKSWLKSVSSFANGVGGILMLYLEYHRLDERWFWKASIYEWKK